MKIVSGRADARWLPSRAHFALFRLLAFLRFKNSRPEPRPGIVLAVNPHQGARENYLVAAALLIVLAAFVTSILARTMPTLLAGVLAIPIAFLSVSMQVVITGLVVMPLVGRIPGLRRAKGMTVSAAGFSIVALSAATALAVGPSPLRIVGVAYLSLLAANGAAAVVVFFLRSSIARAELRFGAEE